MTSNQRCFKCDRWPECCDCDGDLPTTKPQPAAICLRCDALFDRRDPTDLSERFCPSCARDPMLGTIHFTKEEMASIRKHGASRMKYRAYVPKRKRSGVG